MADFEFDFTQEQTTEDLKQATKDLFTIFNSLKEAGFTDDQAMKMIKVMINK